MVGLVPTTVPVNGDNAPDVLTANRRWCRIGDSICKPNGRREWQRPGNSRWPRLGRQWHRRKCSVGINCVRSDCRSIDAACGASFGNESRCTPQKVNPTLGCNFFEPVFIAQPAKNILRSCSAIDGPLMPMDTWARSRPAVGIRNAWSQARVGSSLIVGNQLLQDLAKMHLAHRDHVIQAFTADRFH